MSTARRLSMGTASGRRERTYGPRQNGDGPWPRLRQLLRDADKGKSIPVAELGELIEAAGRTAPSRVGRAESTTYSKARRLHDLLTEES